MYVIIMFFDQNFQKVGKFTIHILYWCYLKMAENTEIHGKNTENETIYTEIKVHRLEGLYAVLMNMYHGHSRHQR